MIRYQIFSWTGNGILNVPRLYDDSVVWLTNEKPKPRVIEFLGVNEKLVLTKLVSLGSSLVRPNNSPWLG